MRTTANPGATGTETKQDSEIAHERKDMTATDHGHDRAYRGLSDDIKNILRQEARFSGANFPGEDSDHVNAEKSPDTEDAGSPRSRGWFRLGFTSSVFFACLLALIYRYGPVISEHLPELEAGIASYSEIVDRGRHEAEETLYWLPELADRLVQALRWTDR